MIKNKELNEEQLDKVTGGKGDRVWYSDMKNVPIGSRLVFEMHFDGRVSHNVILVRLDLDNDSVFVRPADEECRKAFSQLSYQEGYEWYTTSNLEAWGDGVYKIYYTRSSTTYFWWA